MGLWVPLRECVWVCVGGPWLIAGIEAAGPSAPLRPSLVLALLLVLSVWWL